jgi:serine/threonine protein phosphatase PrpC
MAVSNFCWQSSAHSNVGNIRTLNEDAFIERPDIQLWAVADGMGGHHGGEIASQLVVDSLKEVGDEFDSLSEYIDNVEDSLISTNIALRRLSKEKYSSRTIGSTVACLMAYNGFIAYLWAGDSRVYRLRDGRLTQLTQDHSEVQRLIDEGMLDPALAESHPSANVVTKAIGGQDDMVLQLGLDKIKEQDIYLICSDGLYRDISDQELEDMIDSEDVEGSCETLIDTVLSRTAADNVTAIVTRAVT